MPTKKNDVFSGKKLLVVEDDPFLLDIYETKLKMSGFNIDVATTGEDCLEKLADRKYDLMVLDIVLPRIDGWEILSKINQQKKDNSNPNLNSMKIIILSNLGQKEEIKKGLQLGADGFMIKAHFTPSQIVEEIAKALK